MFENFVRAEDLVIRFPIRTRTGRRFIVPVNHVSFSINAGEVLALVGESGSGKTTIGRSLVRTLEPSGGKLSVAGVDITHIKGSALREYRKTSQMIFQDPFGSLNPVKTVERHLYFPLKKNQSLSRDQVGEKIDELLNRVGLTPVHEIRAKYPHELSGGQRQRLSIARALAVSPQFIVADEPISMLDVSIRAGILKLMNELKHELNLSFLYITHDLASARYFGDRIMVLYGGQVMEVAESAELVSHPQHPYTKLLLAATPGSQHVGPLPETSNEAPDLTEGRNGCAFASRCPIATKLCRETTPRLSSGEMPSNENHSGSHQVACHHV